jgi:protein SCO1
LEILNDRPLDDTGGRFLFSMVWPSKIVGLVWAVLVTAMAIVVIAFTRSKSEQGERLPVISQIGDFNLTNQFGLRVGKEDLSGYVLVVDVIFTRCPGQCHRLSQQLAELQRRIPAGAPVRFISLTADPAFDSPEILKKYGDRYGSDGARWLMLTGSKVELYRLAVDGMKFSVVENDPKRVATLEDLFIHSASFALVDPSGRLRAMVQAEEADAIEEVVRLSRLLSGRDK